MRRSDSRSASTVSIKSSGSLSNSKTPPNTAHNLSNASLRDQTRDQHYENLRLRQQPNSLHPHNNSTAGPSPEGASGLQNQSASLPRDQRRTFSAFGAQSAFSHVTRSYSEFDGSSSPQKPTDFTDSPWNNPLSAKSLRDRLNEDITAATIKLAKPNPQHRDRVVSTSFPAHPVSLNHQSANLSNQTARIGSVPQLYHFGDDKYTASSEPFVNIDSKLHQPDRSTREWSTQSHQVDGTMDDLMEMIEPIKQAKGPVMEPGKRTSSKMPAPNMETPPASPSKANASPKKVTSPKHRIQQLASHARDFLGSGSSCGSDRERERGDKFRPESPDPKKMSPEEKRRWKEEWKAKFRQLKIQENQEIRKYKKENPL
jgi:hypothetical protein